MRGDNIDFLKVVFLSSFRNKDYDVERGWNPLIRKKHVRYINNDIPSIMFLLNYTFLHPMFPILK